MAVPKRRTSRSNTRTRRARWGMNGSVLCSLWARRRVGGATGWVGVPAAPTLSCSCRRVF
ncbi:50S ribosomal protein L32 [Protofrankia sp. BMG5.30]|uniref:50S ribosomal protein L32 n=1 Tax=Protofrankia sp. BMG5.30 TaxID=1834514 RepID=UPI0011158E0A|nr:50S ribosomal protein L32 [Protofrankia sp. BMG5.30]